MENVCYYDDTDNADDADSEKNINKVDTDNLHKAVLHLHYTNSEYSCKSQLLCDR